MSRKAGSGWARWRGKEHGEAKGRNLAHHVQERALGPPSPVSTLICPHQVRPWIRDHEGEIRSNPWNGLRLINFLSVLRLCQGLMWPHLHPG